MNLYKYIEKSQLFFFFFFFSNIIMNTQGLWLLSFFLLHLISYLATIKLYLHINQFSMSIGIRAVGVSVAVAVVAAATAAARSCLCLQADNVVSARAFSCILNCAFYDVFLFVYFLSDEDDDLIHYINPELILCPARHSSKVHTNTHVPTTPS
jgi:hypothetical protein